MATTLYLVRHGEADGHDTDDPALTAHGRAQALRAAEALRGAGAHAVLHGSRRRAVETAQLIAGSIGIQSSHRDWFEDRTPIPDDWACVPEAYHEFLRGVPADEADAGARRLAEAVAAMSAADDEDRSVIAVTHNFVIGWFVREVLDAPWWRWIGLNQDNGAITVIRWTPGREARLLRFNDRGHLDT